MIPLGCLAVWYMHLIWCCLWDMRRNSDAQREALNRIALALERMEDAKGPSAEDLLESCR